MSDALEGKSVLITGATGSLGGAVLRRALGQSVPPRHIRVFSRDESKQFRLRDRMEKEYGTRAGIIEYVIGDVRDPRSIHRALSEIQIVIHAAALKHVPICERNTTEAVQTNVIAAENLVHAVSCHATRVEKVIALSTDKACAPFSLMGMTKAIQERIFAAAIHRTSTPFICVRMGNMVMSRGSIVPLFLEQIAHGGPITITDSRMTRFLITLEQAADYIDVALRHADAGQVYIPPMKAAAITRVARFLRGDSDVPIRTIGIRPGEKLSDILISRDEVPWLKPCDAGGYLLDPQTGSSPAGGAPAGAVYPLRDLSSSDESVQMTDPELESVLASAISPALAACR